MTGTRYCRGGGVAGWGFGRKLTSRGANLLASFVLGAHVSDLTGAFRCLLGGVGVQLAVVGCGSGWLWQW